MTVGKSGERIRTQNAEVVVTPLTYSNRSVVRDTAKHEAVHVVLAYALGVKVRSVSTIPSTLSTGEKCSGVVRFSPYNEVVLAGPHAIGMSHTDIDVKKIEERGKCVQAACEAARRILKGRAHQVHAIATALERRRELDGEECEKIMRQLESALFRVEIAHRDNTRSTHTIRGSEAVRNLIFSLDA